MPKLVPHIPPNNPEALRRALNKLASLLGPGASVVHAGLTLTDLTASTLLGANASKLLESVTIGTGLDYTRPTLSLSYLGIEDLTDPNADRILFWDDSETACKWLGVGNSIVITTTTIDTIQDIRTSASPTFAGLTLSSIAAEATDVDKFLVDSTGVIKYRTGAQVLSDIGGQASDAGLTSLAGLTYASDSMVKVTATDTYAIRTLSEVRTDLGLVIGTNVQAQGDVLDDLNTLGANAADSEFLVGMAAGALAWESGATARASIGLGTGDSPQFTGIELGHATDTTITRASAGNLNIEGNLVYRAGGTDVPIGDGGSGQSTAQAAIDTLSAVSGATNEHVLTKDTASGNATWKVAAGGSAFTSKCSVYLSSDQTLTTNTWTKIQFDIEVYDIDGEYDNSSNYRFTATVAGYYHVTAQLYLKAHVSGNLFYCCVYKNGARVQAANFDADAYPKPVSTMDIYLAVNDYIEIIGWQENGVNKIVAGLGANQADSFLMIHHFA